MENTMKNNRDRIVELGRQIWSLLTEDEQERYYMVGTLTFIEDIVRLLNIIDFDYDDDYDTDYIHREIFTY
jgi:hypothetical protein